MNKYLAFLVLVPTCAAAQTSVADFQDSPEKSGGVYYAYTARETSPSRVPKGYRPFYISHYGRHGSRYLISDEDYTRIARILDKAADDGKLTALGLSVKKRVDSILPEAYKRGGDLSPLGVRQQRGIAERMMSDYPEVFKGKGELSARSTTVGRCILSMDAFCERLKELNPDLVITRESSNRYMDYLNYHSPESNVFTSGDWKIEYRAFEDSLVNPERLVSSLINDREYAKKNIRPKDLYWGLYWIASDMQNMVTPVSFYDIFTPEELFSLWQIGNYHNYVCDADYAPGHGVVIKNTDNLINNIVSSAEMAILGDGERATLRFGHDGNLMPLAARLKIEGADASVSDADSIASVWANYKVSPMAGNVQMVFFRSSDNSAPVVVKVLLNEEEKKINGVEPYSYPFYRWEDLKGLWLE